MSRERRCIFAEQGTPTSESTSSPTSALRSWRCAASITRLFASAICGHCRTKAERQPVAKQAPADLDCPGSRCFTACRQRSQIARAWRPVRPLCRQRASSAFPVPLLAVRTGFRLRFAHRNAANSPPDGKRLQVAPNCSRLDCNNQTSCTTHFDQVRHRGPDAGPASASRLRPLLAPFCAPDRVQTEQDQHQHETGCQRRREVLKLLLRLTSGQSMAVAAPSAATGSRPQPLDHRHSARSDRRRSPCLCRRQRRCNNSRYVGYRRRAFALKTLPNF